MFRHEETFGPVLPVVVFETLEDALAMANDSENCLYLDIVLHLTQTCSVWHQR
jgi:acyl-CoA reductase-like NAD-dependent aldehyde dehydrogenase